MKNRVFTITLLLAGAGIASLATSGNAAPPVDPTWETLFDGKSLKGWDGNPAFWSVQDGVITGQTSTENPTKGNTFLIWTGGELADFELLVDYKIQSGNSGIQYRSFKTGSKWVIGGYQADMDAAGKWAGTNYGEKFRGILAKRGQKTVIGEDGKPSVTGQTGDPGELAKHVKSGDWNTYHIIAKGNHLIQKINGTTMSETTDQDASHFRDRGLLALQLHAGPPMSVQFRNIRMKRTKPAGKKKIVFMAGRPSHGWGAHEHRAGCVFLSSQLNTHLADQVYSEVRVAADWPANAAALEDADSIIFYCDGGKGHMANQHLDGLDVILKDGCGLACLHYGVETTKGPSGNMFLKWIGGYFELHWSVNPHWKAEFTTFPQHPITRGVKPFTMQDEWYFHMRFQPGMKGVTPILSTHPPQDTMKRKDGPHSGNPEVRKSVAAGEIQHLAWAYERPNGGRGFGFTGGHWHRNWANENFRKLVLNAIAWTAKAVIPADGISSDSVTEADLDANQDYPRPKEKKK